MNILIILACSIIIGQFTIESVDYGRQVYEYDQITKKIHKNDAYDNCVSNALNEWKFDDEEKAFLLYNQKKQECTKLKVE